MIIVLVYFTIFSLKFKAFFNGFSAFLFAKRNFPPPVDIFRAARYNILMNLKEKILSALRAENSFSSGEELAARFGVSRQAVNKAVRALETDGYSFERVRNRGYRLSSAGGNPDFPALERRFPQVKFVVLAQTDSTNSAAGRLYLQGERRRSVVFAREQTQGRARHGDVFQSPAGKGLYVSLLDFPALSPKEIGAYAEHKYRAVAENLACDRREQRLFRNGVPAGGMLVESVADPDRALCVVFGVGLYLDAFSGSETQLSEKLLGALLSDEPVGNANETPTERNG